MRTIVVAIVLTGLLHPTVADEADTIWIRKMIQLNGTKASTKLELSASGSVAVYFNGQRLTRGLTPGDRQVRWDVSSLTRNGRNCVAVSLNSPAEKRAIQAALVSGDRKTPINGWKVAPSPPPVGWQTTDFNDRDWKPGNLQGIPDADQREVSDRNWSAENPRDRSKGGRVTLKDGDHVVLLGGTFIERAQQFGHLEAALNADPARNITFRNLGWSGDTVYAESRGIFDTPERGYERMIEHVRAEEPSVIVVSYGQNESMVAAGTGADRFKAGLTKLAKDLATTGAELVFLTPHPFVKLSAPLPDATRWNKQLRDSATIIRDVAALHQAAVIDLNTRFTSLMANHAVFGRHVLLPIDEDGNSVLTPEVAALWTSNGMHWNDDGYRAAGQAVAERFAGEPSPKPVIRLDPKAKKITATGCETRNPKWADDGEQMLTVEYRTSSVSPHLIAVRMPDNHPLVGVEVVTHHAEGVLAEALAVSRISDRDGARTEYSASTSHDYEKLRSLTAKKNELYFHRWRPQNITYLFGFRKHEQGNNASEIAKFDPLVDELEKQIHQAKQPGWKKIVVTRRNK